MGKFKGNNLVLDDATIQSHPKGLVIRTLIEGEWYTVRIPVDRVIEIWKGPYAGGLYGVTVTFRDFGPLPWQGDYEAHKAAIEVADSVLWISNPETIGVKCNMKHAGKIMRDFRQLARSKGMEMVNE